MTSEGTANADLRRIGTLTLLALVLLAGLLPTGRATANGDFPSQELTRTDVFLPLNRPSERSARAVENTARRAREAGYPMKVAIVQSAADLGTLANLFDEPQRYANYLATDLASKPAVDSSGGVLVVMPAGAGVAGADFDDDELVAARATPVKKRADSDELTQSAKDTLVRMADAAGKNIGDARSESGSSDVLAIVLMLLLLLAVAAGAAVRWRWGAKESEPGH